MSHSGQASMTTFLHVSQFTKGYDSAKMVLYSVVSDGRVLGLYVPLPPAVLVGFPQEANVSLQVSVGRIVFLSAVFVVFHSRYQSTLIPVPPSIRPS